MYFFIKSYIFSTFKKGGAKVLLYFSKVDLAPPFLKVEKVEKVEGIC
jgi:hypothetical protein